MERERNEAGQFGNDIGNGLMSCGCLIMLIPMVFIILFVLGSVVAGLLGAGE